MKNEINSNIYVYSLFFYNINNCNKYNEHQLYIEYFNIESL